MEFISSRPCPSGRSLGTAEGQARSGRLALALRIARDGNAPLSKWAAIFVVLSRNRNRQEKTLLGLMRMASRCHFFEVNVDGDNPGFVGHCLAK